MSSTAELLWPSKPAAETNQSSKCYGRHVEGTRYRCVHANSCFKQGIRFANKQSQERELRVLKSRQPQGACFRWRRLLFGCSCIPAATTGLSCDTPILGTWLNTKQQCPRKNVFLFGVRDHGRIKIKRKKNSVRRQVIAELISKNVKGGRKKN